MTHLPPGPSGRLRSTYAILRNPREFFDRCVRRYGDPFTVHSINGTVVVTGRPELVQQVFRLTADDYVAFPTESMAPLLGWNSILMMDGPKHRSERKTMAPLFHGQRMKAYGDLMQSVTLRSLERLSSPDQRFTATELGTDVSLEVIVRAVFGAKKDDTVEEYKRATADVINKLWPPLVFAKKLHFRLMGLSPMDRFVAARDALWRLLDDEINSRDGELSEREDILSLFAQTTDQDGQPIGREHLYEEIQTLLFAGHETTALTIAWTMYHLHKHPEWLKKIREEIRESGSDDPMTLMRLPILRASIEESLRLTPVLTETLRQLRRDIAFGDYQVPAGSAVAAAASITHYDPNLYADPDRFDPQRFLDAKPVPHRFLAFGGGDRKCLGMSFAMVELMIVIGTLLHRYDFALLERGPVIPKRRNATMAPSRPIAMSVTGQRSRSGS